VTGSRAVPVERIEAAAYDIPTDRPESDGTLEWTSTVVVVVQAHAGGRTGVGYTYGSAGCVDVIGSTLGGEVCGGDALQVGKAWASMVHSVRNVGWPGVAAEAISAVDIALWDLKAKLLELPLVVALDAVHDATPIYGSGGFCSYSDRELAEQLTGWVDAGIPRVKMKTGREPARDPQRLTAARKAIGDDVELFVDANGAFGRKEALAWAATYAGEYGVRWFEEPVSSDDLAGLRLVRDRAPGGLEVAAGEYGYRPAYFRRMLEAQAVDCLQADVTRCGGITGFLKVAGLCDSHGIDLSAHCAPQVSAQACTAVWHLRHLEYFHDHNRIERLLFDGVLEPEPGGRLRPDRSRPGLGLELKPADVEQWRVR
jgi:L-alanine-DL-glutamate epimerase-like enolase superfamily enzyme